MPLDAEIEATLELVSWKKVEQVCFCMHVCYHEFLQVADWVTVCMHDM